VPAVQLHDRAEKRMRYLLLWLIGIPLPILFIIWLLFS
jgi:hypothetical protein